LRLLSMLDEFAVGGLRTNLAFLRRIIAHPAFADAELDTGFIPRYQADLLPEPEPLCEAFWQIAAQAYRQSTAANVRRDDPHSPWTGSSGLRLGLPYEVDLHLSCAGETRKVQLRGNPSQGVTLQGDQLTVDLDGVRHRTQAIRRGDTLYLRWKDNLLPIKRVDPIAAAEASDTQQGGLCAPMNGSIVRVLVEVGQQVEAGTPLVVLEAMKMEHSIRASQAGTVAALYCAEGEMVSEGAVLVELSIQPL
jgi:3-methylcrotonyl-CoA carboxylase alpha subunit